MDLHRSGPPPRVIDCLRAGLPLSSLLQHLLLDLGHPDVLVLGNTTAQLRGSSSEPRSVSPRFRCHAAKHVPNVSDLRVHKLLPRDPLTGTRGPESTAPLLRQQPAKTGAPLLPETLQCLPEHLTCTPARNASAGDVSRCNSQISSDREAFLAAEA